MSEDTGFDGNSNRLDEDDLAENEDRNYFVPFVFEAAQANPSRASINQDTTATFAANVKLDSYGRLPNRKAKGRSNFNTTKRGIEEVSSLKRVRSQKTKRRSLYQFRDDSTKVIYLVARMVSNLSTNHTVITHSYFYDYGFSVMTMLNEAAITDAYGTILLRGLADPTQPGVHRINKDDFNAFVHDHVVPTTDNPMFIKKSPLTLAKATTANATMDHAGNQQQVSNTPDNVLSESDSGSLLPSCNAPPPVLCNDVEDTIIVLDETATKDHENEHLAIVPTVDNRADNTTIVPAVENPIIVPVSDDVVIVPTSDDATDNSTTVPVIDDGESIKLTADSTMSTTYHPLLHSEGDKYAYLTSSIGQEINDHLTRDPGKALRQDDTASINQHTLMFILTMLCVANKANTNACYAPSNFINMNACYHVPPIFTNTSIDEDPPPLSSHHVCYSNHDRIANCVNQQQLSTINSVYRTTDKLSVYSLTMQLQGHSFLPASDPLVYHTAMIY
jgi:hypothetical protein